jgi:TetR/AcrR family fatty acid metabolism transcriptional regulator
MKNEKKQAILVAAQEVFSKKGLANSTVSEIAKRADVVDSMIYHYYKHKEDLLFYALADLMEKTNEQLLFHFQGLMGSVSHLGKMIWSHLYNNDFSSHEAWMMKNLLLECRSNKSFYQHEGYKSLKKYSGVMLAILNKGIKEKFFRDDLNVLVIRDMIFGFMDEESLSCLVYNEIDETLPDFDAIISMILAMISVESNDFSERINPAEDKPNERMEIKKSTLLLNAATLVLSQKGYHKATMLEISEKAGVAEGTIYEYFKNKKDLLFSIPDKKFEGYQKMLEQVCEPKDPLRKLECFIAEYFRIFSSNSEFLTIYLYDLKLNKQFYTINAFSSLLNINKILYDILDEGKQLGVFRSDLNNRVFRNLFVGSFSHLAMRWFILNRTTSLQMMSEFSEVISLLCLSATRPVENIFGKIKA